MTAWAEVIGDPIAQSKSPVIHGFWIEQLGLDARYEARLVHADGLADYLDARRGDADWCGCNVTMPHKQAVLDLLDEVDPVAARIGAVNTIFRRTDGTLVGTNTDMSGFLEPVMGELASRHLFRMARVLGTGGAARAIVAGLAEHGFTIVLAGRDPEKARGILDTLALTGEHYPVQLDHFAGPTDFAFDDRSQCLDLVVNASPLGMRGQPALAFDWSHAPPGSIAYDIVTDPVATPFLDGARARGLATIDGLAMLVGQAAGAFELFFGVKPPRDRDSDLRDMLAR